VRSWSSSTSVTSSLPRQLGLVPQTILERTAGVLLGDEELYRFRVVKLGERIQTHRLGPNWAIRGEAPFQGLDTGVSVAVPKLGEC
jgi:hypothetical protein